MNANNQDLELAPLVADEQTASAEKSSFSKTFRATIALGALLILGAVATFSYQKTRAMTPSTNLSIFESSDVALCDNTFIYGLTPRTAQRGCVVLSVHDMYGDNAEELAMPTKTICLASSGPNSGKIKLNKAELDHLGYIVKGGQRKGLSILSGVSPGEGVTVTIYEKENFEGESSVIRVASNEGELPSKFFPSGMYTNDNVMSLEIVSDTSDFFAGDRCGVNVQVCEQIIPHSSVLAPQPEGCVLMTTTDPTVEGRELAHFIGSRFCVSRKEDGETQEFVVKKKELVLTDMVHRDRDHRSLISYINKGPNVDIKYYAGSELTGESGTYGGALTTLKYDDGMLVRDHVNSFTISSHVWRIPKTCELRVKK